ncbi:MAG: alpha/beta fold hydrolase [Candidatus Omnitrophica bacterium]|nr:alpha/beta fold hydrolase [Candidatus Omnitrophota bacterium]
MNRLFIATLVFVSLGFLLPVSLFAGESVLFTTKDDVEIHGVLERAASPKGTIVLLHVLDGKKEDCADLAGFLCQNGWNTLCFDFRGHGESLRRGKELVGWREFSDKDYRSMVLDVEAACQFLKDKGLPVSILIGNGIGANLAANYAANDPFIRGVVLFSPGLSYRGVRCERAIYYYGDRNLFIVAPKDDESLKSTAQYFARIGKGPAEVRESLRRGTKEELAEAEKELRQDLADWLDIVMGLKKPPTEEELRARAKEKEKEKASRPVPFSEKDQAHMDKMKSQINLES